MSVVMEDRFAWNLYLKQALTTGEMRLFDVAWQLCHRNVRMDSNLSASSNSFMYVCIMSHVLGGQEGCTSSSG
jgi:hypothetical protein